jgi:hypothetical protein
MSFNKDGVLSGANPEGTGRSPWRSKRLQKEKCVENVGNFQGVILRNAKSSTLTITILHLSLPVGYLLNYWIYFEFGRFWLKSWPNIPNLIEDFCNLRLFF